LGVHQNGGIMSNSDPEVCHISGTAVTVGAASLVVLLLLIQDKSITIAANDDAPAISSRSQA
jgi:hypothetical protein